MPPHPLRLGLLAALLGAVGPAFAAIPVKIYGQELVDRALVQHPELQVVLIKAAPQPSAAAVVIASNIGQIGTPANPEDLTILAEGRPETKPLPGGTRVRAELPLLNVVGEPVGTLTLEWDAHAGTVAELARRSGQLRDALARRILNGANLLDPFPLDPAVTTRNHAQKLVEQALAAHPEIEVLALRGCVGPANDLVLLGSSFGRQGKKADGDDLKVLASTAPNTGVYSNGKRFGVDLSLHDQAGATVGTMNVGYAYHSGDDSRALIEQALKLRDELQQGIPAKQPLDALDP